MDTTPQTGNSEADELLAEVQAAIAMGVAAAAALNRHGHAVPARGGIARLANTLQDALKAVGYGNERPADLGAAARAAFYLTKAHTASDTIPFGLSIGSDVTERIARTRANLAAAREALAAYQDTQQPQAGNIVDLDTTYTVTYAGDTEPTAITPQVRTKTKNGVAITAVSNLTPLLADRIDAIEDEAARQSTLLVLRNAVLVIRDTPDDTIPDGPMCGSYYRDRGTLGTTYAGTGDLPVSAILDLADELRSQLGI